MTHLNLDALPPSDPASTCLSVLSVALVAFLLRVTPRPLTKRRASALCLMLYESGSSCMKHSETGGPPEKHCFKALDQLLHQRCARC